MEENKVNLSFLELHGNIIQLKHWIFLLIFLFSKVTNTYGSFSITKQNSLVIPGDTIILLCKKSDELQEAVFWRDNSEKLTTCMEDGECQPQQTGLRTQYMFIASLPTREFYMIIKNATQSDFKPYICGDSRTEANCNITLDDGTVKCTCKDGSAKSECCSNGSSGIPNGTVKCTCKDGSAKSECCSNGSSGIPKRIEEEGSQAVSMMGLFVSSIVMNVILICIVVMVKIRMNQQTRKHNDQRQPKADDDGQNEDTKKLNV